MGNDPIVDTTRHDTTRHDTTRHLFCVLRAISVADYAGKNSPVHAGKTPNASNASATKSTLKMTKTA